MADSTDPFHTESLSEVPASWFQDPNTARVFGWLRPLNELAQVAFHQLICGMLQSPESQLQERKFIHVEGEDIVRSPSVSGSDDQGKQEPDQRRIVGAFKFSTAVYPKDPTQGWYIGTGREKPEVDVLIGPLGSKWKNNGIRGNHARLYIHKESCVAMVEAHHNMEVSGSTGLQHIDQNAAESCRVLEHGHQVQFGKCAYLYLHGDAMANGNFYESLPGFMQRHHGNFWRAHEILSAASTSSHLVCDGITFLPGAFAGGTYGEVTVGWTQNGSAVAVKRFKKPNKEQLRQHQKIMGRIGKHANVLELVHTFSNLEPAVPALYCVYRPLALANLEEVVTCCSFSLAAQITLLLQYLHGLAFLHDTKGIMHRDIKPCNLGVVSFHPLKGVILDLDAATTEKTSVDHMQGTVHYLAPEIIDLKLLTNTTTTESFEKSVDVWALGVSAFHVLNGRSIDWNKLDHGPTSGQTLPGTNIADFVLEERLAFFHGLMGKKVVNSKYYSGYYRVLKGMTEYDPGERLSTSLAIEECRKLKAPSGEQPFRSRFDPQPISGTKRKAEH